MILQAEADHHRGDYKSSLQERTLTLFHLAPFYRVVGEVGEEHDKTFSVEAILREDVIGSGDGKTRKEASSLPRMTLCFTYRRNGIGLGQFGVGC